ncbi:Serine/threonine-protein kinase [Vermiconidia calcicola]|uniref:Serine/threonine-protein kinase n=1 Tax=Vermiconidia calcicola TaxID=1690605 RepID=A0ACC3NSE0_9PEZI|nr:Serine/threonine-protein kinase [Vermiconidia calcicola]
MGQGYSLNTLPAGPSAIETSELSDLTFERPLGGARFLRTVRARHQHGVVVVKVCAKNNPTVSFKHYANLLKAERQRLRDVPNVLPYQKIRETSTLGVLVRQFIHSSLYDRVSIRPFLENVEKKWIAFQLLCAVRDCHARDVFHGDIKSENVLVTSWGWVYLTDFASTFKPVYLPEDNPADFSFYYDTSARRTCYLAPERFLAAGEKPGTENVVQWNMDIFSLGCVIAELFTEAPTFTLSQLFRYRKGEYDPTVSLLNKVENEHVRALISSMIRLDPQERWHAQDYLDEYKDKAFPLYFYQHLHTLMQEITDPTSGQKAVGTNDTNNGVSDDRIERIYSDFEMLSVSLGYVNAQQSRAPRLAGSGHGLFPLQIDLPNHRHAANSDLIQSGDNGTFILLNVVTASLRNTARASSRIRGCELLLAFAERLPDEAKLDRILPYIMPLLDDTNEMVLVAAIRTMTQLLALVQVISPVNSFLFTQYIFPRLQHFVATKPFRQFPIVRATYAACLASLAETASRFLDMMQALRADGSLPAPSKGADDGFDDYAMYHDAYDATRAEMLDHFELQTTVFVRDKDTAVRRAFLGSVSTLCVVFGEVRASDVILSHLNTYLNDPDWTLKCAFLRTIVGVAVYVGGASLEDFILPLMLQALTDPQEFVIEQALRSLASMAEMGLLQRAKTWELVDTIARFEMHPNLWIKEAASHFVAAATTYLSMADIRILVAPLIKPYLKVPVGSLTEVELLDALRKPVPRAVLDLALQWAAKLDRSVFWKQAKESRQLEYSASSQMPPVSSVASLGPKSLGKVPKTSEDEQWLGRLRNAGMRSEDEIKILAFREYLWRAAQRIRPDDAAAMDGSYDQVVSLSKLQITPQTVIFDNDVNVYRQRLEGYDSGNQDIMDVMQEAMGSAAPEFNQEDTTLRTNGVSIKRSADEKQGPLKLPALRRQTSGSGDSLSASPNSGIGLLGKERGPRLRHKSSAPRLLSGSDLKNKSLAEVATDDATAAGRLNRPAVGSRRTSPNARSKDRKQAAGRAAHNYAGNDPTVLRLLDAVYVDNFPSDAAEFGPMIQPRKRAPIPSSSTHTASGPWRPQGQLVAVLGEHSDRVTRIAIAPDHTFFITASDDSEFRIWDTARLERNVTHRSRFRQSLGAGIRVTSVCFIESTYSFVCTGSDGSVHLYRVPAAEGENGPKYSETQAVRTWQIPVFSPSPEYAVWSEHFRGDTASTLVLATNLGRILAVDLRYMSIIFDLRNPAQHGTPTCFCISRRHDWLLVGTSYGILDLWDLRFRMQLRYWAFPNAEPITRLQLHPSRKTARRNRVCVSGGTARGDVTVWDIEKVICHEIYRPAHLHRNERLNARDYELRNLEDERSEGLLSRVAGSVAADKHTSDAAVSATAGVAVAFFGLNQLTEDSDIQHPFAVAGGPDNKVRFWDCDRLDGCRLVSRRSPDEQPPTYALTNLSLDTKVMSEKAPESIQQDANAVESLKIAGGGSNKKGETGSPGGSGLSRYETIRMSARSLLEGHLDSISDVALLEQPFGMVVTADRSGQVFVHQ